MTIRTILVDGYNVLYAGPTQARPGATERAALVSRLVAAYRHTPHEVIVVFDGDGPAETVQPIRGIRGRVIYSRAGERADDVLVRLAEDCRRRGAEVVVVSNDGEVRAGSAQVGAEPTRADDLLRRVGEAPRDLERRFLHRQAVRKAWETPEEPPPRPRSGNPRRAPRRRRGRDDHPLW